MEINSFAKCIERVAMRNSVATVFSDFLEMSVCALSFGAKEERYLEIVRCYDKQDAYKLSEAFAAMVIEMDNNGQGLHDMLGDFFMEHISHGHNGQFFTPEPICQLMANVQGEIADGTKIYDCACGSARTLLAAAKINRRALFFGADVDRNCCFMSLINLCLNGLEGEIACMNSLTNEFYSAWRVKIHPINLVPYIYEITADECYQLLKPRSLPDESMGTSCPEPIPEIVLNREYAVQQSLFE